MATFSFSRLGKLVIKQFFENSRLYIFSILALFCLLSLVFTFWIASGGRHYKEEETWMIFLLGLFISGSIFASMSFSSLASKDKGIYWLSIPATHFEKLVCTIFYTTILFTIAYCLCFFAVKSISVSFLIEYIKNKPDNTYTPLVDYSNGFGTMLKFFMYGFFAVQALYLLGSVYFSRYSFIITTVVGGLIIFAFGYYISELQDGMKGDWELLILKVYDAPIRDSYKLYSVPEGIQQVVKYAFQFAWAPLFWIVTWFRLKEKEI